MELHEHIYTENNLILGDKLGDLADKGSKKWPLTYWQQAQMKLWLWWKGVVRRRRWCKTRGQRREAFKEHSLVNVCAYNEWGKRTNEIYNGPPPYPFGSWKPDYPLGKGRGNV